MSGWGKYLVVERRKLLDIGNSYNYSDEFCSKRCYLIWTIQIRVKLDGAQGDAFLPVDVIRVDFLEFYLFVVTSQT